MLQVLVGSGEFPVPVEDPTPPNGVSSAVACQEPLASWLCSSTPSAVRTRLSFTENRSSRRNGTLVPPYRKPMLLSEQSFRVGEGGSRVQEVADNVFCVEGTAVNWVVRAGHTAGHRTTNAL